MGMEKNLLQKWCDQAWFYCLYLLGIAMGCVLLIQWGSWDVPQKLMCLLAVMIPVHVFEENHAPGGFFFMNNLGRKSDAPLVYPQNRFTNMLTNLGAEIFVIGLTFLTTNFEAGAVVAVIIFGIGECVHHTNDGRNMIKRYKSKGKTTLYGPGTITSFVCLLPMTVYGCYWLTNHSFKFTDVLIGVGFMLFIMVGLIIIPLNISGKIKTPKYAFKSAGYFDKYEGK